MQMQLKYYNKAHLVTKHNKIISNNKIIVLLSFCNVLVIKFQLLKKGLKNEVIIIISIYIHITSVI